MTKLFNYCDMANLNFNRIIFIKNQIFDYAELYYILILIIFAKGDQNELCRTRTKYFAFSFRVGIITKKGFAFINRNADDTKNSDVH